MAKMWITELQMKTILAGVWKLKIKAQTPFNTMLLRITVHTLIQFFDLTGVRQESLIDDRARHQYRLGVYLRWHHVSIELVDYTSDNEPIFIVYGKAPPSKTGKAIPELGAMPFMMMSGGYNQEFSVDRDLAVGSPADRTTTLAQFLSNRPHENANTFLTVLRWEVIDHLIARIFTIN
jgi:hypothetical protein